MRPAHLRHWPGDRARPALALHCMMGSGASWGPVAEGLARRVDLHGIDLPGHGRSAPWAPGGASFADTTMATVRGIAGDLAARSADGRLDLLGHSFGAVMALRLAVETPGQVRSLTLIEPVMFAALPPDMRDPDGLLDDLAAREAAGDRAGATAAFLRYWDGPDPTALPEMMREQVVRQMAAVIDAMPDLYQDRGAILRPGGLEALDCPAMIVSGALSPPLVGRIAAALVARLPDATQAAIPDAAHMAPITRPLETAAAIAANLDRA